jgi:hypothetical protein
MNVLIVDGFSDKVRDRKLWEEFEKNIKIVIITNSDF